MGPVPRAQNPNRANLVASVACSSARRAVGLGEQPEDDLGRGVGLGLDADAELLA